MVNYQVSEYVQNNDLVCFGISSHDVEEWLPTWTPKAQKDIDVLRSWMNVPMDKLVTRPSQRSDWNWTNCATKAQMRILLGLAVIRELPIKNFYTRCFITYWYLMFTINRGAGRGFVTIRPIYFHDHQFHFRAMLNYPDMLWANLTRVMPRNPPTPNQHLQWRNFQQPVYHQVHKACYRYRFRKPRYLPWDGSQNQPTMPYLHDEYSGVINGTFKRNVSTAPDCR